MKIGIIFPQTEIGPDPWAVLDYAQAAEEMGYAHLVAYDHVLGADPSQHPGWQGPYTHEHQFHEPFVLFSFLAAVTKSIELATGILILPQRQTALVAKQAAEVDVLSQGRLRLGVGLGWNQVEYEALGEDFHTRGRRVTEQITVLRALWTQPVLTFHGRWHTIVGAGIKPLPVQRPIPIWMGGGAGPVLKRVGRLADGWIPRWPPNDRLRQSIETVRQFAREAQRDPNAIGIEGRINYGSGDESTWSQELKAWQAVGATHLDLNTMGAGLRTPQQHIEAIGRFKAFADGLLHSH
jgi:probable F420-dependent oxidoreductase